MRFIVSLNFNSANVLKLYTSRYNREIISMYYTKFTCKCVCGGGGGGEDTENFNRISKNTQWEDQ